MSFFTTVQFVDEYSNRLQGMCVYIKKHTYIHHRCGPTHPSTGSSALCMCRCNRCRFSRMASDGHSIAAGSPLCRHRKTTSARSRIRACSKASFSTYRGEFLLPLTCSAGPTGLEPLPQLSSTPCNKYKYLRPKKSAVTVIVILDHHQLSECIHTYKHTYIHTHTDILATKICDWRPREEMIVCTVIHIEGRR